jgi:hypothetical protein
LRSHYDKQDNKGFNSQKRLFGIATRKDEKYQAGTHRQRTQKYVSAIGLAV